MTTPVSEQPRTNLARAVGSPRRRLPEWFGAWEVTLAVVTILALVLATIWSPFFATGTNFSITAAGAMALALMVLPMAGLMISGEIDLSVASVFGLAGVVFGMLLDSGLPLVVALIGGLVLGTVAGLINGALTTAFGLPSLVVTLGTLGLYRGLSFLLLENRSISAIPKIWTTFAQRNVPGTHLPYPVILFIILAALTIIVHHRGRFGRAVFAIGSSAVAARYSGIRVTATRLALFAYSGMMAALAGMLYVGYVSSARADNGTGLELTVIAVVLIGGISMFGGKGSIVGVILSLVLVTTLTSAMNLRFVATNVQNTVIGALMIAAVVIPVIVSRIRNRILRAA